MPTTTDGTDAPAPVPGPGMRRIDVGEVSLAVDEAGVGEAPLLLVHGFTGAKEDFADWLAPLAAGGWHVVAPDLRGHGASDAPSDESAYSLATYVADLVGLVEALGWHRPVVLGHSMGGMVTQALAINGGVELGALVLMDTHHGPLSIDPGMRDAAVHVVRSRGIDGLADLSAEVEGPLATPANLATQRTRPGYAAFGDAKFRRCSAAMYAAMATELCSCADRLGALGHLDVATLVLVGEQDAPFLDASHAMAATIPGARLAVLDGGGHSPQFEAPVAWWAALAPFLEQRHDERQSEVDR